MPVYNYNSRLEVSNLWTTVNNNSSHFLLNIVPNWGTTNNNGNLLSVSEGYGNSVPANQLSWLNQNYSYDSLNRLSSVADTGYTRSFSYDAYGNSWVTGNSGVSLAGNTPTSNVFNGANQMAAVSYDAARKPLCYYPNRAKNPTTSPALLEPTFAALLLAMSATLHDHHWRFHPTPPAGQQTRLELQIGFCSGSSTPENSKIEIKAFTANQILSSVRFQCLSVHAPYEARTPNRKNCHSCGVENISGAQKIPMFHVEHTSFFATRSATISCHLARTQTRRFPDRNRARNLLPPFPFIDGKNPRFFKRLSAQSPHAPAGSPPAAL